MRTLFLFTAILLAGSGTASAQGLAYGVGGPAVFSGFWGSGFGFHVAGGGEFLVNRYAGVGGEYGLFGNSGSLLGVTSINGVAHFADRSAGKGPFLTAGYSRFSSGEGAFNALNFGIGADFWYDGRTGLRVEVRDHLRPDSRGAVHYISIRVGVTFK